LSTSPGQRSERAARRDHWRARGASWNQRDAAADRARDDRLNRILIEAAGLTPGMMLLDLGTGGGEPALTAARAVGHRGGVIALDHAPEMLEGARRRAATQSLHQIRCVVADMIELPFADRSFDAVTARFSLMSVPDRQAALREALRVLRPGGRAAFLVWGPEDGNDRFRTIREAARAFFGDDANAAARHSLGAAGAMLSLLREAGFTHIDERLIDDTTEIPADRPIWKGTVERTYGDQLAAMTTDERAALDAAMLQAFARFRHGDVYRLRLQARLAAGAAPG
jgi:SAM-dependent methyltransferase